MPELETDGYSIFLFTNNVHVNRWFKTILPKTLSKIFPSKNRKNAK